MLRGGLLKKAGCGFGLPVCIKLIKPNGLNTMRTVVISLGGSLVSPEAGRVDTAFLKKFRAVILKYAQRGQRFAVIVGGGKVARAWQEALRMLITPPAPPLNLRGGPEELLDWIGIRATQLNAELVRAMFGSAAYREVAFNPAQKTAKFKVLVGAGFVPGHSTDYDAVVRAKTIGAKTVINLSNVPYVYDKDPRTHQNVKPLRTLSWREYLKRFGTRWVPGANVPFDSKAAHFAQRAGIRVIFLSGRDLKNVELFFQSKSFRGTVIG